MRAAQKTSSARRARDSMHHLLLTCESQFSGHIVQSSKELSVSIDNSMLHLTLDIESLRMALLYCCELVEAKPCPQASENLGKPFRSFSAWDREIPWENASMIIQSQVLLTWLPANMFQHRNVVSLGLSMTKKWISTILVSILDFKIQCNKVGAYHNLILIGRSFYKGSHYLWAADLKYNTKCCIPSINSQNTGSDLVWPQMLQVPARWKIV